MNILILDKTQDIQLNRFNYYSNYKKRFNALDKLYPQYQQTNTNKSMLNLLITLFISLDFKRFMS